MKKITFILASILIFSCFSFAANGFKEGNKLYLNGKYQDAVKQYEDFIQKNPEYYEGYFNAGNAMFRQEQYDAALGLYKKAQEINPKDPDIQYNIEITQKKMQEKQKQCDNPQDSKNGQQQDQKNQKGKNGQQQQQNQNGQKSASDKSSDSAKASSDKSADKQQAQNSGKTPNPEPRTPNNPPSGMTEDEVQALLNQKQNQEKSLQQYFGKQYQKQNSQDDIFNMSPQEIMQYMMQRQMDPNFELPQKGGKGGNEKDW